MAPATDNDQDWSGDARCNLGPDPNCHVARREVTVLDDDELAPQIKFTVGENVPLVGTGYTESHGLRNAVQWTVTDASGNDQVNASDFEIEAR